MSEPMLFRQQGSSADGELLSVTFNSALAGNARAGLGAVMKLGGPGVMLETRHLTLPDKAFRIYGKREVIVACIALLLAVVAAYSSIRGPSVEQKLGRAELASRLQVPAHELVAAAKRCDAIGREAAQINLPKTLDEQQHSSPWRSNMTQGLTILLSLSSGGLAIRLATKKAKTIR